MEFRCQQDLQRTEYIFIIVDNQDVAFFNLHVCEYQFVLPLPKSLPRVGGT